MLARAAWCGCRRLSKAATTIPMPFGGQGTGCDFSPSDNVVDPASPMMIDIPNPMEGNSASHLSYTGLPGPAHTVVVNPADNQPRALRSAIRRHLRRNTDSATRHS